MRELCGGSACTTLVLSGGGGVVRGNASPMVGNASEIIPRAMHASLLRNNLSESLVT